MIGLPSYCVVREQSKKTLLLKGAAARVDEIVTAFAS